MTLNFHDFDWLLEKDKPHGLQPIEGEDMARYASDPDAEQAIVDDQCNIRSFDAWAGKDQPKTADNNGDWQPIKYVDVGVRQQ